MNRSTVKEMGVFALLILSLGAPACSGPPGGLQSVGLQQVADSHLPRKVARTVEALLGPETRFTSSEVVLRDDELPFLGPELAGEAAVRVVLEGDQAPFHGIPAFDRLPQLTGMELLIRRRDGALVEARSLPRSPKGQGQGARDRVAAEKNLGQIATRYMFLASELPPMTLRELLSVKEAQWSLVTRTTGFRVKFLREENPRVKRLTGLHWIISYELAELPPPGPGTLRETRARPTITRVMFLPDGYLVGGENVVD